MKTINKHTILSIVFCLIVVLPGCYDDPLYPLADFSVKGGGIRTGYKIMLDGSASMSQELSNNQLQYRWDLNGDHKDCETSWGFIPIYVLLGDRGSCFIGLQVKDANGNITEIYNSVQVNYQLYNYSTGNVLINTDSIKSINYLDYKQIWLTENLTNEDSEGVTNNISSAFGSYYTWEKANEKNSSLMVLPSLQSWQDMIDQSGGIELAGYNFPVVVEHGLKLTYGGKYVDNSFSEVNECGYFWTSTAVNDSMAYAIKLTKGTDRLDIVSLCKNYRLSVRLFKDYSEQQNN
jgi:uncharacterized protein (TIGR02145 family)